VIEWQATRICEPTSTSMEVNNPEKPATKDKHQRTQYTPLGTFDCPLPLDRVGSFLSKDRTSVYRNEFLWIQAQQRSRGHRKEACRRSNNHELQGWFRHRINN